MGVRPRLLLVPGFTELEWVIKPQLEQWADVITFDPPGVGANSLPADELEELANHPGRWRERAAEIALAEIHRRGWRDYLIAVDGEGIKVAARIAAARPTVVKGLALGHACLRLELDGERPTINREIWAAMNQLLEQDYDSFVRHGITQMTAGSYGDDLAEQMIERLPMEFGKRVWRWLESDSEPFASAFTSLDCPVLLAKHKGCLLYTEEGFADAVAAFPEATTLATEDAPSVSPDFAEALRSFCEQIEWEPTDPAPAVEKERR